MELISAALSRLAKSAVRAAQRAYGTTPNAALVPSMRQRIVRSIFFKPVGVELIRRELLSTLEPWLLSNHISRDAAIEGLQALDLALESFEPDTAALMALADPAGMFQQLQQLTPRQMTAADGAAAVYEFALHRLIEVLKRLAPRADGMTHRSVTYLVGAVGDLARDQDQLNQDVRESIVELDQVLREFASKQSSDQSAGQAGHSDQLAADGLDHAALVEVFSPPRMRRYQELMGTDQGAVRLYRWNVEISAELYRGLSVAEVALRNAMDKQLRLYNLQQAGTDQWIDSPSTLVSAVLGSNLTTARRRAVAARLAKLGLRDDKASQIRQQLCHDDFLAQMTFSAWRWALPHSKGATRQRRLWFDCLCRAFPGREQSDVVTLAEHVDALYITRNRVAHLEPILDRARTRSDFRSICWILEAISPDAFEYYVSGQQITSILGRKPGPGA